MAHGLEHLFIISRFSRFKQEHLDECSCMLASGSSLAEVHTGLDNLRIVEHHECPFRQIVRQMIEDIFFYITLAIDQEFRVIAVVYRELGDTLVRQVILIVTNVYMPGIDSHRIQDLIRA